MTFKDLLKKTPIFRFILDHLPIQSALGEKVLLSFPFMKDPKVISHELEQVAYVKDWFFLHKQQDHLCNLIHEMKDFSGILKRLKNNEILDDIDLFEIKRGALCIQKIGMQLTETDFHLFQLHNLSPVIHHLDPEETGIPHFYIYSAYDTQLAQLRKEMEKCHSSDDREQLFQKATKMEDQIRKRLSISLRQYVSKIEENLHQIGKLDLWIAKAKLAHLWNCCQPEISNHNISYKNLFHPITKDRLSKENKKFQSINVDLYQNPTLITGANMSGKTIFLKSIAFAQYMFQFGMFVPARKATICPVEEIFFSIGDQSSELSGLSSFAFEILTIHHIIQETKKERKLLILVDELARTTNPSEGVLLVNAFLEMMNRYPNFTIITTHYSGIKAPCRRLRVKGLQIDEKVESLNPKDLNQYMDYTLVEILHEDVPQEALKISRLLGVDADFLELTKKF